MPITQDRLKALADAGQSIAASFITQGYFIARLLAKVKDGGLSAEAALDEISSLVANPEATIARDHKRIEVELMRWQFTHTKNEQESRRLARRRAEHGFKPKHQQSRKAVPEMEPQPTALTHGRPEDDPDYSDLSLLEQDAPVPKFIAKELPPEAKAAAEKFIAEQEAQEEYEKLVRRVEDGGG